MHGHELGSGVFRSVGGDGALDFSALDISALDSRHGTSTVVTT